MSSFLIKRGPHACIASSCSYSKSFLYRLIFFSAHIIQKIRISEQAYNWEQAQRQFFQKYRISQSDIFMQKARSLILWNKNTFFMLQWLLKLSTVVSGHCRQTLEFLEFSEHAECHNTRESETMCSPTIPGISQYFVKSYLLYIGVFCLSLTFHWHTVNLYKQKMAGMYPQWGQSSSLCYIM